MPGVAKDVFAVPKAVAIVVGERVPDILERTVPVASALAVDTQSKCRV